MYQSRLSSGFPLAAGGGEYDGNGTGPSTSLLGIAEVDGRIAGSNFMDERSVVRGIGPITVDPAIQNTGIGRQLMKAAIDRAAESKSVGVRLLQAGFHNRSLSLYTSLGFVTREPVSILQGKPLGFSDWSDS